MKKAVHSGPPLNDRALPVWQRRWFMGACAGLVWFLIFSAGILIDSMPHRKALGWKSDDTNHDATIGRLTLQLVGTDDDVKTLNVLRKNIQALEGKNDDSASAGTGPGALLYHFLCGVVLFTPINVALLALVAGFVGGCASNEADVTQLKLDLHDAERSGRALEAKHIRKRLGYLQEHPASSMMRSFVVYLVFISGLYVVATDPFSPSTQAQGFTQYIRLAGLVSLFAFMVGYDPTRFNEWLDLVPSPVHGNNTPSEAGGHILATAEMQTPHGNVQMQLKETTSVPEPESDAVSEPGLIKNHE